MIRRLADIVVIVVCCSLLASCEKIEKAIAPSIVGKWQSDNDSSLIIEFFPDGTYRGGVKSDSNATYLLLDGGRMKLAIGKNVVTLKYSISGNKLTMAFEKMDGGVGATLNWTRVK